jgi:ribosomal protein S6
MQDAEDIINNADLVEKKGSSPKVYELGYLLVPTIKEEDVPITYGNLKELVSSFGGEVISDDMPKVISLAYTMQKVVSNVRSKFNTAYFGWIKFMMDGEQVLKLKSKLDLDPNLIRFLIIKTVKENTIATKRFVRGETYTKPKAKSSENETVAPINKEEIDKEIDALIAV